MNRNLADFEAAHPEIAAWWTETTFDFAISLKDQVIRRGFLSERQMIAAHNCVAKARARQTEREAIEAAAPAVNIDLIEKAFTKAVGNGLARPKMRLAARDEQAYILSLAPAFGRNAGAVYVKRESDGEYMGKIFGGKFTRVNACDASAESAIVEACSHPEESAVAYGRLYGSCSCCGRTLTNALSIELGIGPICREKFF